MFYLKTLGLLARNKEFLYPNSSFFVLLLTLISRSPMTSEMPCLSCVQGAVCEAALHQTILLFVAYIAVNLISIYKSEL